MVPELGALGIFLTMQRKSTDLDNILSTLKGPPLWYRAVMNLPRGKHRILELLRRTGRLNGISLFPFYSRKMALPLEYAPPLHRNQDIRAGRFSAVCNEFLGNFDFVDCGASLGFFSVHFWFTSAKSIKSITAIEPNPFSFALLKLNLSGLDVQVECLNAAVSDFVGRGRLRQPEYDRHREGMYLEEDPRGDIAVISLSSILRERAKEAAAIKVDVEGAEAAVLCGAADAIRSLKKVALFVEVHKKTLARIGSSDVEMLAKIESIRPFKWSNSDDGQPINPQFPIFQQLKVANQCDLIGVAAP